MRIVEITEKDYDDVVLLAKEIFDFDYLLTKRNDEFNMALSRFVTSTIVKNATGGYFIENDEGKKIAMLNYGIPNDKPIFSLMETDFGINLNIFKKYIRDYTITQNEKLIINKEIDIARSFEILYQQYESLLQNKAEIKLLYVAPEYRGKSLSKILIRKFYDDLTRTPYDSFYLFTTTEHNYKFYEKLKMKALDLIVYDNNNAPEYFKYKFKLPYKSIVYMGNKKETIL
ncbi:GNAT family N-acetyltransferase [Malacoplasma penetrans]|uniref:Predicted acetyltransferase (GNAT) family protein n=1 Tax=Malacoplasma penetrans (strain HF-2) TaxID=272633 RepID=Q8EV21_MALP2|nr:GNAT family N-acetyltransferase [Malacoplasma penetrans]RXY96172.1 GNAT family N-acetyltransferase [Malacoplasma penetrans]BAC44540.1 predicted acetyltransferase (GNAT) family protein [Malacoplasma penetrans HF-2]